MDKIFLDKILSIIILYFAQQHWIAHISSVTFCAQEKHWRN